MAFTKITTSNLDNIINTKLAAAEAANAAVANIVSLAISSVQIADSLYNVLDDTAANTGGGFLVINGTGFTNQCVVIVGTTNATSTTFANTRQLRAQVPALSAATYPVYVVDSVTGATAIKINGLTYSPFPAWSTGSTLSNQRANTSFSVALSANSDSNITYANTTALPAGTTLAANGLFSGTITIGVQTIYSFDVQANDAQNQDASRTFSLTVTISPPPGIWTFGRNDAGALGLNDRVYRSSPTQVGAGTNWSQISKGQRSTIATKTDGTLWAWGFNSQGQCAQNDAFTNSRSSPTQVGVATNWSLVSAGSYHLAAIKTDGTLWVWGINNQGQLGLNDTANRSSPTQVGVATNWSKINGGAFITFAGKTDGTLWAWGHNQFGRLGLNDTNSRSSPVQVGVATNWSRFEVDSYHTAATKTDGTLWLWGSNGYGQFGNNSRFDYRSSPVQLGATTNWSQIDVGQYQTTATKTDGTLWVWGRNTQGTLGLNDTASRSSPTQSGTGTNWSMISTSVYNNLATKTDGTLWSWGRNTNGQLGQNDTASRSSPTQIGTATNWTLVSVGSYSSMARTT